MKKTKRFISTLAVALVAAIVFSVALIPNNASPLAEKTEGVNLSSHISSGASVETQEYTVSKEIPQTKAATYVDKAIVVESPPARQEALAAAEKLTEEELDVVLADEKEVFQKALAEFQALGAASEAGAELKALVTNEKGYRGGSGFVNGLLAFADILMGEVNPVASIVEIVSWLVDGVEDPTAELIADDDDESNPVKQLYVTFTAGTKTDEREVQRVSIATGLYIDTDTWMIYGKDEKGIFAFGYDADAKNLLLYTPVDSWQRCFGFSIIYDFCSPLIFAFYTTVRVKFSHGSYDWMIQMWKGSYSVGMGSEIGLYHKPTYRFIEFYDCATDSNLKPMSMQLIQRGKVIIDRAEMDHWWMTGFTLSLYSLPKTLTMCGTINFKDVGMMNAFIAAAKDAGHEQKIFVKILDANVGKIAYSWGQDDPAWAAEAVY